MEKAKEEYNRYNQSMITCQERLAKVLPGIKHCWTSFGMNIDLHPGHFQMHETRVEKGVLNKPGLRDAVREDSGVKYLGFSLPLIVTDEEALRKRFPNTCLRKGDTAHLQVSLFLDPDNYHRWITLKVPGNNLRMDERTRLERAIEFASNRILLVIACKEKHLDNLTFWKTYCCSMLSAIANEGYSIRDGFFISLGKGSSGQTGFYFKTSNLPHRLTYLTSVPGGTLSQIHVDGSERLLEQVVVAMEQVKHSKHERIRLFYDEAMEAMVEVLRRNNRKSKSNSKNKWGQGGFVDGQKTGSRHKTVSR